MWRSCNVRVDFLDDGVISSLLVRFLGPRLLVRAKYDYELLIKFLRRLDKHCNHTSGPEGAK